MRRTTYASFTATLLAVIGLPACAAWQRGPELPKIDENRRATYRLDIPFQGHGSGTVISREGHVLTAAHVAVAGDLEITIEEGGGVVRTYPAAVVAIDPQYDIAIVKIERHFDRPAALEDPANVHPGDLIYNVGYPYDFGEMVGRGYVQKLHYDLADEDGAMVIKDATLVDMPDGPGTSGSGIFLARSGKLIGVMSMALWAGDGRQPPTVTRVLVSVEHVRDLLTANGVKFLTEVAPPAGPQDTALAKTILTIKIAPAAKR